MDARLIKALTTKNMASAAKEAAALARLQMLEAADSRYGATSDDLGAHLQPGEIAGHRQSLMVRGLLEAGIGLVQPATMTPAARRAWDALRGPHYVAMSSLDCPTHASHDWSWCRRLYRTTHEGRAVLRLWYSLDGLSMVG